MQKQKKYYLGLDIGTDSVGYAITDEKYELLKFRGKPAWGVTIFDSASTCRERRGFRANRRRLDRRKQRVDLLQELFAKEISNIDLRFFIRLEESRLFRDEVGDKFTLFNDLSFTDKDYYKKYPTIHHLIVDLIKCNELRDIRLLYLACAWLVSHRGHFLSNINEDNIAEIKDFEHIYKSVMNYFETKGYEMPWEIDDYNVLKQIIKEKTGVNNKKKRLVEALFNGDKPSKEVSEDFPFRRDVIINLIAGGTCKLKDLFENEEYEDYGSISLSMDDDKLAEIAAKIGDDYELIATLRKMIDWAVLVDVLGDSETISEAKVAVYNRHKSDLKDLKSIIKKYRPEKYSEIFRNKDKKDNYLHYSYHVNAGDKLENKSKKANLEDFLKYIKGILSEISPEESDMGLYNNMKKSIELRTFMPKQKNTDNRVIPYQVYLYELKQILNRQSAFHPFLNEIDETGIDVKSKIISIFKFRIPYFVGPLNGSSEHAWIVRKEGKIYPWNFEEKVDFDKSELEFIKRMTNTCTYLPGKKVLPKNSLAYHKFTVLNEINSIKINGERIDVELKQKIYEELFMKMKKVTRKKLTEYLICNGIIEKGDKDAISGIDEEIKSNLSPYIDFRRMMEEKILSEKDVERIIERSSYAEDKIRLHKWLDKEYPTLSAENKKYICSLKFKDFGRLSREFLCEMEGACKETGEVYTILGALWNTQNNLMELLSDKYTFGDTISDYKKEYYSEHKLSLSNRLEELYVSNSVKRPIYRTLAIVKDIEKAFGVPEKIFVETTRSMSDSLKGKRIIKRKDQILELYKFCNEEDVRHLKQALEEMGESANNKLQGDKLFLYYMQLGKCMYTGKTIDLDRLGTDLYNIDHIYPQAYVKDDSVINNKVLVLSGVNGGKEDRYPLDENIRNKMEEFWKNLVDKKLISETKYKRLIRNTPFTEDEKRGFINRQLVETSQATKAVATILKERFKDTEIVYCKAGLVSDFRHKYDIPKSRIYNDLHHAVDAYLNIVTGNVYSMKFTKNWFNVNSEYSIKVKKIFKNHQICNGVTVWGGENMLASVKKTAIKNTANITKYAFLKRGGLFDQQPVKAKSGLIPLKKELETSKYGGYNSPSVMFYIPVKYKRGKKFEIIIMSVEVMHGDRFLRDEDFAKVYAVERLKYTLGKTVEEVSFPMGMRPWKVNTMLSLDGFRVCISGISSGGKCLIPQPMMQFSDNMTQFLDGKSLTYYLKKLESFVDKVKNNSSYIYDEEYDKVSKADNLKLYDIYIKKYETTIYNKRINPPVDILIFGREKFENLDIKSQSEVLLNIHSTFGRIAGSVDLRLIGGVQNAAATSGFSATISNWKKKYSDVRIIDISASGLWEKQSENLLDLL